MPSSGIIQGIGPNGQPRSIRATADGELEVDSGQSTDTNELLRELILEIRLLRMGMIWADNPVCVDFDGERSPLGDNEE